MDLRSYERVALSNAYIDLTDETASIWGCVALSRGDRFRCRYYGGGSRCAVSGDNNSAFLSTWMGLFHSH
jgi:hypothetical protein